LQLIVYRISELLLLLKDQEKTGATSGQFVEHKNNEDFNQNTYLASLMECNLSLDKDDTSDEKTHYSHASYPFWK